MHLHQLYYQVAGDEYDLDKKTISLIRWLRLVNGVRECLYKFARIGE